MASREQIRTTRVQTAGDDFWLREKEATESRGGIKLELGLSRKRGKAVREDEPA